MNPAIAAAWPRWKLLALQCAALLLPALSLLAPSGYSWGAALLVVLGLIALPGAVRHRTPWPVDFKRWAIAIAAMGAAWAMHTVDGGQIIWNSLGLDRTIKYSLALVAVVALLGGLPATWPLRWGCWLGACGAGLMAVWQWYYLGMDRAEGHTNAIQFGNISLLLAFWSWVWVRRMAATRLEQSVGWLAVMAGAFGSLASGSRGGWIVAPLLVLLVLYLDRPRHGAASHAARRTLKALALGVLVCVALAFVPPVQDRLAAGVLDVKAWRSSGEADSSIGQRLAHWKLAWGMALERPVLGWGQQTYQARKQEAVTRHEAPPVVAYFNHAHNEWMDMFVKRGLLGVLGLCLFFAIPLSVYWRHLQQSAGARDSVQHVAALCGVLTVVGYFGFGMTQVMFAHNNGNMMYLFMNLLWVAALASPAVSHAQPQAARPA